MVDENDPLRKIERCASDMAELLKGLEATASIIETLGLTENAQDIETENVAHMMSSFREQLSTIRSGVQGIADIADEALLSTPKRAEALR